MDSLPEERSELAMPSLDLPEPTTTYLRIHDGFGPQYAWQVELKTDNASSFMYFGTKHAALNAFPSAQLIDRSLRLEHHQNRHRRRAVPSRSHQVAQMPTVQHHRRLRVTPILSHRPWHQIRVSKLPLTLAHGPEPTTKQKEPTMHLINAIAEYIESPYNPKIFQNLIILLRIEGIDEEQATERLNTVLDRLYPVITIAS